MFPNRANLGSFKVLAVSERTIRNCCAVREGASRSMSISVVGGESVHGVSFDTHPATVVTNTTTVAIFSIGLSCVGCSVILRQGLNLWYHFRTIRGFGEAVRGLW